MKVSYQSLMIGFMLALTNATVFAFEDKQPPNRKIHAVITSETTATISSPMAGYITELHVKDGGYFKKDDLLVSFDCRIFNAELKKSQAEVKMARINKQSYQRLSKLGSASDMQVVESVAKYDSAIADEKIAEKHVSDCHIRAPFDGQVTELFIHQHETIQLHEKMINVLSNSAVEVRILVPSHWLAWIKIGTPFKLYINETNKSYPAKVKRIIHHVDAVSRSVKLIGEIDGQFKDLKSGMSGDAVFLGIK